MNERMRFIARRLAGEPMAVLCREFGISRKTGYKIFERYQECGIHGLTDRSRRPFGYANQLPLPLQAQFQAIEGLCYTIWVWGEAYAYGNGYGAVSGSGAAADLSVNVSWFSWQNG